MSTTLNAIAELVGRGVVPLLRRLTANAPSRQAALLDLGYGGSFADPVALAALADVDQQVVDALIDLDTARIGAEVDPTVAASVPGLEDDLFNAVVAMVAEIKVTAAVVDGDLPELESRLYGRALADGLSERHHTLFNFLVVAGIVDIEVVAVVTDPADPTAFQIVEVPRLRGDRLLAWFSSPKGVLAELYGWGTSQIDTARLYSNLQRLLRGRRRDSVQGFTAASALTAVGADPSGDGSALVPQLSIPLVDFEVGDVFLDVAPFPVDAAGAPQALAMLLDLGAALSGTNQLNAQWALTWTIQGNLSAGLGVVLKPDAAPRIVSNVFGDTPGEVQANARVEISRTIAESADPAAGAQDIISLGSGSAVRASKIRLFLEASTAGNNDIGFGAAIDKGRLVIDGSQADGFLSKLLAGQSVDAAFDAEIDWTRSRGVHFQASGGLRLTRPVGLELGPFRLTSIDLELEISGGLTVKARADVGAKLGPVDVTVQGLGAHLDLALRSGNV
ncbi:MAG TPA: hypothetical protein VIF57_05770, partial [Polyangia bacterium]